MSFGQRLSQMRKKQGLSQEALGEKLDTTGVAIGRYERDEVTPSVEIATRLAKALGVSLDYLVGLTDEPLETDTLQRVLQVQRLEDEDRQHVLFTLDAMLRDAKAREAYTQNGDGEASIPA
jgi:transcriptional regulator with XRE-family HTH domain